jgi:hypothetical protein
VALETTNNRRGGSYISKSAALSLYISISILMSRAVCCLALAPMCHLRSTSLLALQATKSSGVPVSVPCVLVLWGLPPLLSWQLAGPEKWKQGRSQWFWFLFCPMSLLPLPDRRCTAARMNHLVTVQHCDDGFCPQFCREDFLYSPLTMFACQSVYFPYCR